MGQKIVVAMRNKIGFYNEAGLSYLNSQYLKNYKKNVDDINKKHEWKTQGINAQFRGDFILTPPMNNELDQAVINGIKIIENENKIIYSVEVERNSGIFIKNLSDDNEIESHVIHDSKVTFCNLDHNPISNNLVVSIQCGPWERNIAIMDIKTSRYQVITEGDSIDDNPVWSKKNNSIIYFESTGIGRNPHGDAVCFSPRVVNKLDTSSGELCELISFKNHDCIYPKIDSEDNIYFIKRPYQNPFNRSISFKEYLFIPFKIIKALFVWIEFFTIKHTGEPLVSKGSNPAKSKHQDPQNVIINGNIINAEKIMKENIARGEKHPGIAPKEWELTKRDKNGNFTCIKKGVIGFDVNKNGDIICSNGKYILKIDKNGKEDVIEKLDTVDKISII